MTIKKEKYKNAGVKEYWMVDVENERIIVHRFEEGDIVNVYTFDDIISVGIFAGDCMIDFTEISERIDFLKM